MTKNPTNGFKHRVLEDLFLIWGLLVNTGAKKTGDKLIKKSMLIGYVFPKKLGLDSKITSWDLKNRIPRRKLPI